MLANNLNTLDTLERRMEVEVAERMTKAEQLRRTLTEPVKRDGRLPQLGILLIFPLLALALLIVSTVTTTRASAAPLADPAMTAAYGANDYYVLVHDCKGKGCIAAADWTQYEWQLQQLFKDGTWGRDVAVVSHSDPHEIGWAAWAEEHVYYVDEANPRARVVTVGILRSALQGQGRTHVLRVASIK